MEHLDQKKKVIIMIAIMAAMLFAALNQTIVGTALPRIIAELGGMEYFSWVFTIYMLASSITAILVGKLSDIYGRKPFILIGIGVFSVGSFLAGMSDTIGQLIAYRAIQGLGGGMIMSTAFTAVGDLFAPRERGRWQGIMSGVFGLASVFGPTLGGWIVDNADWHWIFWVFLPVGVIAFIMILMMFPASDRREREPVDYMGSLFLTLTIIPLLLAFSWGGSQYAWASLEIIGLFVGTIVALLIFIFVERKAKSPVLPLHLFNNSIFTLSNSIGFLQGAGMFGAIMYMPFFVQGVIGTSATASGLVMMPMTLSMVIASAVGGSIITKTGKYKKMALLGLIIMAAGMISMTFMGTNSTNLNAVIHMIIVGTGLGISFPVFTLTIQNAVEQKLLGVATASSQLFRQIGGTVGVAIMGTIMATRMQTKMEDLASESGVSMDGMANVDPAVAANLERLQNPQVLMDPDQLAEIQASLPEQLQMMFDQLVMMLRESLSYALTGVFLIGGLIVAAGIILTIFLKEIPLRQSNEDPEKTPSDS
ncbi:MDR family MFS transporter [Bacillus sp. PS06]|uniref:MDR family MFS transporter n=1 Tax=Bacillus sp. PS06 TaxID=2764176 RepID=UPI00177B49CF|nr:MDR family MFS transporter [Bacillus sp. PS06]MBD8070834.1 DHA2 family efflux MFS transporter permease subunit [Bacillus sp. PS06]